MWQALDTRLFPVQFISPSSLPFPQRDHSIFTFPPCFFAFVVLFLVLLFFPLDNLYNLRPLSWSQVGFRCGRNRNWSWKSEEKICVSLNIKCLKTSQCSKNALIKCHSLIKSGFSRYQVWMLEINTWMFVACNVPLCPLQLWETQRTLFLM